MRLADVGEADEAGGAGRDAGAGGEDRDALAGVVGAAKVGSLPWSAVRTRRSPGRRRARSSGRRASKASSARA